MSMAAGQAVEISNWAIGICAGVPLVTFLAASAGLFFGPEFKTAWAWLKRVGVASKRQLRRFARWVKGTRRDVRVSALLWLTEHRFQNIAAYLGLRPAELGIL